MYLQSVVCWLILLGALAGAYTTASAQSPDSSASVLSFLMEVGDSPSVSDAEIARLERLYLDDTGGYGPLALVILENALVQRIVAEGIGSRLVIPWITAAQPSDEEMPSRFTLAPSPGSGTIFRGMFMALMDQLVLSQFSPLPDRSRIRFSGEIPFPLRNTPGLMDGGVLSYSAPGPGINNRTLIMATPVERHAVFHGSTEDPASFVVLKEFGLVYMHGKGRVVLPDSTSVELP